MKNSAVPLPQLDELNHFFWTSGADGILRLLRCDSCRYWIHPPGPVCPQCLNKKLQPEPVSGLATIEAFTINYQAWAPGLETPYVIAIVNLDEQQDLRLTTNIIEISVDDVRISQRVRVKFSQREDVWLPLFTPIESPSR